VASRFDPARPAGPTAALVFDMGVDMSLQSDRDSGGDRENPKLWTVLSRGLIKASFTKLNLLLLGAAATGAALAESWSVLLFATASFVMLTALKLCNGRFWNGILADVRNQPIALPETSSLLEAQSRSCIERIVNARQVMRQVAEDVPPAIREHFSAAIGHIPHLESRAVALASRIEELSRYLSNISYEAIRLQMQTLESRRRNTSDTDSQENYSSAHAVRAQHLAALDEIGAARERSCAALDHVVGVLERLPSHMMMIRALEAEATDRAGNGLGGVAWFEDELMRIEEEWRDVVDGSRVVSLIDSEPELEIEIRAQ
jgi:hypothetical protein